MNIINQKPRKDKIPMIKAFLIEFPLLKRMKVKNSFDIRLLCMKPSKKAITRNTKITRVEKRNIKCTSKNVRNSKFNCAIKIVKTSDKVKKIINNIVINIALINGISLKLFLFSFMVDNNFYTKINFTE